MANPNKTEYVTDERTINTGTTNLPVQFGTLRVARHMKITNRTSGYAMTVKFNGTGNNASTIDGGKSLILNDEYVTSAYLSNASGASINFSVLIIGG